MVDDGSEDKTLEVVKKEFGKEKFFHIISLKQNYGKGYAIRKGMLKAQGEIRLFTDADNSTDISHFELMKPFFDKKCDVVIGSRNSKDVVDAKQIVLQKWSKRLFGSLGNLFIQLVAVRGIWDTQCGFKAFRGDVAERLFNQTIIDRWAFDIEVLVLARKFDCNISIIPVKWVNDFKSHVKPYDYFQVLFDTLKIKKSLIKGGYK